MRSLRVIPAPLLTQIGNQKRIKTALEIHEYKIQKTEKKSAILSVFGIKSSVFGLGQQKAIISSLLFIVIDLAKLNHTCFIRCANFVFYAMVVTLVLNKCETFIFGRTIKTNDKGKDGPLFMIKSLSK